MTKYRAKKPNAQGYIDFTAEENGTWQILIERQLEVIKNRACDEFISGLEVLDMPLNRIPQCSEISKVLQATTGWSVVSVAAIIPLKVFFSLLASRQFPAASFIRVREELNYVQEPDIFHEYFGHCPLLTHQAYADFMEWYGQMALGATEKAQSFLGRLLWFTTEFGLLRTKNGLRIYGGGILSSYQETIYALESEIPQRLAFDIHKIFNMAYRYDQIQSCYFYIHKLSDLFQLKNDTIIDLVNRLTGESQDENFVIC